MRYREQQYNYECGRCRQPVTVVYRTGKKPIYCPQCAAQLEAWRRQDDRDSAAERMRRHRDRAKLAAIDGRTADLGYE